MRDFMLTFLALLVVWYIGFLMGQRYCANRFKEFMNKVSETMKKHLEELKNESDESR